MRYSQAQPIGSEINIPALEKRHKEGLAYVIQGEGPPVILVHGIAASLYDWTNIMPALAHAGYRSYALDLPGHGESDKPDDPDQYHVDILQSRLSHWINSLSISKPFLLLGHSLGGYLSLVYADLHPEQVRGMVLIDPFYTPEQLSPLLRIARHKPELGAKTMRMVPEWLINTLLGWDPISTAEFTPEVRKQIANDYKRASPHFVRITSEIPDITSILPTITVPTRVIWGERDLTLKPDSFPRLVDLLPNAEAAPIHSSGHQPHIGKPELVAQMVLEFAATLPPVD